MSGCFFCKSNECLILGLIPSANSLIKQDGRKSFELCLSCAFQHLNEFSLMSQKHILAKKRFEESFNFFLLAAGKN